MLNLLIWRI